MISRSRPSSVWQTLAAARSLRLAILALAVSLSWLAGSLVARAQDATCVSPPTNLKLGALSLTVLHDKAFTIPNDGATFGLNASPQAVSDVLHAAGAPTDQIALSINVLLIRLPDHLVLIDTGYGAPGHGALWNCLSSIGVAPEQVTDVFITHGHPDHVSGLVHDGRSAFPKAVVRLSSREWASMQTDAGAHDVVAVIMPQVQTFEPGQPVLPGITPVDLPGHTPGHVGYRVESQHQTLLDLGDMAHSSIVSLAKPGWTIKWDFNKDAGVTTRSETLQRVATTHELVFAPHFSYPGLGTIEAVQDGYRLHPRTEQ